MKKHNILWYYIFTLVCTIILGGLTGTLFDTSRIEQYAISLTLIQMSPLLGVIIICMISKDWDYIKGVHWNPFSNKRNIPWTFISILIPTFIITCSAYILSALGKVYVPNGYNYRSLVIIVIASIIGCIGEEFGWRGFMLRAYNKKNSLIISAAYTGVLWGIWHIGKISEQGIIAYLLFVVMITQFSIIMAWIYSKTSGNLVCMIIFHLSINVTSVVFLAEREGVFFYLIGIFISTIICTILLQFDRKGFGDIAIND